MNTAIGIVAIVCLAIVLQTIDSAIEAFFTLWRNGK